jgi:hypothetical protein
MFGIIFQQVTSGRRVTRADLMANGYAGELNLRNVQRALADLRQLDGISRDDQGRWAVAIPWDRVLAGDFGAPLDTTDGPVLRPSIDDDQLATLEEVLELTLHDPAPVVGTVQSPRRQPTRQTSTGQRQVKPFKVTARHREVHRLAERDGWACYMCDVDLIDACADDGMQYAADGGRFVDPSEAYRLPHVEHRVPQALAGSNDLRNKALACTPCNLRKSSA